MSIVSDIKLAGQSLKTILIDYTEQDGSNEGLREIEPYSFRGKNEKALFFGYDIKKHGIRSFNINTINKVVITDNSYSPRWPVEL